MFKSMNDDWEEDETNDNNPRNEYTQERSQIMYPTLYIEMLPANINNDGLYNLFASFGTIMSVNTLPSKIIPNTKIGFVVYNSLQSIQKAIRVMNGAPPYNLTVKMKLPKKENNPFPKNPKPMRGARQQSDKGSNYTDMNEFGRPHLPSFPLHVTKMQTNGSRKSDFNGSSRKCDSDGSEGNEINRFGVSKSENSFSAQSRFEHDVYYGRQKHNAFSETEDKLHYSEVSLLNEPYSHSSHSSHAGFNGRKRIETNFYNRQETPTTANKFSSSGSKNYYGRCRTDVMYSDEDYGVDDNDEAINNCEDKSDLDDDFPTLAITINEKGRCVDMEMPKISRVKSFSTCTALSKRPEFCQNQRDDSGFEMDDEVTMRRKQHSEMSHYSNNQTLVGKSMYYTNKSHFLEKGATNSSEDGAFHFEKTHTKYKKNSEFENQSFTRVKHEARNYPLSASDMQPIPYKRPMNNQKDLNLHAEEWSPITAFPLPQVKFDPPPIGETFRCHISHFEFPAFLWIQFQLKKLKNLIDHLNDQQKHADNKFKPRIGGIYLIDHQLLWFRGRIIEVNRNCTYNVFLIDYGKTVEDIPVTNISLLSNTNLDYPALAVKCKLSSDILKMYKAVENVVDAARDTEVVVVLQRVNNDDFEIIRLDLPNRQLVAPKNSSIENPKSKLQKLQQNQYSDDNKKPVISHNVPVKTATSNSLAPVYRPSTEDLPKLNCELRGVINVILVYVNNAENICVCLEECIEELGRLVSAIGHYRSQVKSYAPQVGELVLAKSVDDFCYRAEILEVFVVDRTAKVIFVDYGNMELVDLKDIQPIPPEALEFPLMGLTVSLDKKPKSLQPFNEMLNKSLQMKVLDDTQEPILVEFYCNGTPISGSVEHHNTDVRTTSDSKTERKEKSEKNRSFTDFFTLKDLKHTHIDLGPIEATFGWATDDSIYILPEINENVLSILKRFNENNNKLAHEPQIDELCLVSSGGEWHRAACMAKERPGKYIVFFIDYGTTCEVNSNSIRPFITQLVEFPAMAVACQVEGYPGNEDIKRKIQSLESLDSDIECDVIRIKEDYVEIMLI